MLKTAVYPLMQEAKTQGKKQLAVLIDPDKADAAHLEKILDLALRASIDFFFVGGSLVMRDTLDEFLRFLKKIAPFQPSFFQEVYCN